MWVVWRGLTASAVVGGRRSTFGGPLGVAAAFAPDCACVGSFVCSWDAEWGSGRRCGGGSVGCPGCDVLCNERSALWRRSGGLWTEAVVGPA